MSSFLGGGGGGGGSTSTLPVNTYTTSHTLNPADAGAIVEMNVGAGNTVTVPFDTAVSFPIGTWMKIVQIGAGTTTVIGDSQSVMVTGRYTVLGPHGYSRPPYSFSGSISVVVHNSGNIAAQWDSAFLYKRGVNEWVLTL